jgi:hypothetical protein
LSLLDEPDRAWRTMHTESNTWCSAAVVLPDKGARILNVAGWSHDAAEGLRFYTPDGSPGVSGTNDWQENPNTFHLQVRWRLHSYSTCKVLVLNGFTIQSQRWYPTALVLSNGSVLVMGGIKGSNGTNNPTLEILPQIPGGDTQIYLEFLDRTALKNQYPFLHVLPSGGIFVGQFEIADFSNFVLDTHGQGITTRHVFLTRDHSPPSKSFPTSLVLSLALAQVELARIKAHPYFCPNMLPTRTQSVS